MQVQTYECEETAEETVEMADAAIALIEKMDLHGQKQLIAPPQDGEETRRIPYREMTAEERWVFEAVCPTQTRLREYGRGPIPLRVLQVAAHASELEAFDEIEVWAAEPQRDPDPVLVACIGKQYSDDRRYFLLARWGEELDEWPAMLRKAVEIARAKVKATFAKLKTLIEADAAEVDSLTPEELRSKGTPSYFR
jgi:hypothetical protein